MGEAKMHEDLSGQAFGRLTVVQFEGKQGKHLTWKCKCACGKTSIVLGINLKSGHTSSCGCLREEMRPTLTLTHGMARSGKRRTSMYRSWAGMLQRCTNSNNDKFQHYGARGITVCARWLESFENFYADMGEPPTPKHSIDRKDVNGDYCPDNCKWSTQEEQCNNKRNNLLIEFNGQIKTIPRWSRETGICLMTLRNRILELGWPVEKALTTPPRMGRSLD